jgi:hypothetical protein
MVPCFLFVSRKLCSFVAGFVLIESKGFAFMATFFSLLVQSKEGKRKDTLPRCLTLCSSL